MPDDFSTLGCQLPVASQPLVADCRPLAAFGFTTGPFVNFDCRLPKCTSHDLIYVDLRKVMAMPTAGHFFASGLPIAGRFAASGLPIARCFMALGLPVAGRFAAFGLPIAQRANRARANRGKWHCRLPGGSTHGTRDLTMDLI